MSSADGDDVPAEWRDADVQEIGDVALALRRQFSELPGDVQREQAALGRDIEQLVQSCAAPSADPARLQAELARLSDAVEVILQGFEPSARLAYYGAKNQRRLAAAARVLVADLGDVTSPLARFPAVGDALRAWSERAAAGYVDRTELVRIGNAVVEIAQRASNRTDRVWLTISWRRLEAACMFWATSGSLLNSYARFKRAWNERAAALA